MSKTGVVYKKARSLVKASLTLPNVPPEPTYSSHSTTTSSMHLRRDSDEWEVQCSPKAMTDVAAPELMGPCSPKGFKSTPNLGNRQASGDKWVASAPTKAPAVNLAALGPSAKDAIREGKIEALVAQHVASLQRPAVSSRYQAAENLASLGPLATSAVGVLLNVLQNDSSVIVRKSAACALGAIATEAAVTALHRSAQCDEDKFVRQRAMQVLEELGCDMFTSSTSRSTTMYV